MPTAQTGILGMQEDAGTGKIVAYQGQALQGLGFMSFVTEAFIRLSGVATTARLYAAATSGAYMLQYCYEVITGAASATQTPFLQYFSFGTGAGQQLTSFGSTMALSATGLAMSGDIWIRSAASDIFVGASGSGNPQVNLHLALFRAS